MGMTGVGAMYFIGVEKRSEGDGISLISAIVSNRLLRVFIILRQGKGDFLSVFSLKSLSLFRIIVVASPPKLYWEGQRKFPKRPKPGAKYFFQNEGGIFL